MQPINVYNVCVSSARGGGSFSAICTDWPSVKDIREIIEGELLELQRTAHMLDVMDEETEFRVARIWHRADELKALVSMLRVAKYEEPTSVPYSIPIILGGIELGSIEVISAPAYGRPPPE
jgi:hypothetical protein